MYIHGAKTYLLQIDPRDRQIQVRISARVACIFVVPKRGSTLEYMVCVKCLFYIDESGFLSD